MLERKSLQSAAISLWLAAIDAAGTILHARLSNCQGLVTTARDRYTGRERPRLANHRDLGGLRDGQNAGPLTRAALSAP
jgi:hypothetical protein